MIKVACLKNFFRPHERETDVVEFVQGMTVRDALPQKTNLFSDLRVWRNGFKVENPDEERLSDNDFVVAVDVPGVAGFTVWQFVAMIAVSFVTGAIARALMPSQDEPDDPRDEKPTYGFGGFRSHRVEGRPISVAYGQIRTGGQIISESIEQRAHYSGHSRYTAQICYGEGPIRSIGDYAQDTPFDAPALTGDPRYPISKTLKVDGNFAGNIDGIEAHVRLGYNTQKEIRGFNLIETYNAVGSDLLSPETTADPPAQWILFDPVTTANDEYWEDWAISFDLTADEYDHARITLSFTRGLGKLDSSGNVGVFSVKYGIRFIELSGGVPITTGGNFSDGYVRLPRLFVNESTRTQFETSIVVPLYDPQTYTPATVGYSLNSRHGTGDWARTVINPFNWTSGDPMGDFSVSAWVTLSDNDDWHSNTGYMGQFFDMTASGHAHGWGFGVQLTTFEVAPGQFVDYRVPTFTLGTAAGGRWNVNEGGQGNEGSQWATGTPSVEIDLNELHHYVFTHDSASTISRVYLDGDLLFAFLNPDFKEIDTLQLYIMRHTGWGESAQGTVDEARIYAKTMTPVEVFAEYNYGYGRFGDVPDPGLLAGWHFDDNLAPTGVGTLIASDYSGNGVHIYGTNGGTVATATQGSGRIFNDQQNETRASNYRVEVARLSPRPQAATYLHDVQLAAVSGAVDEAVNYAGFPVLGVRVNASEQLSGSVPNITEVIRGRFCRKWDGQSQESPSFIDQYSTNPAFVSSDIVLNATYGLGQFFTEKNGIDVLSCSLWAQFCNEVRWDGVGDRYSGVDQGWPGPTDPAIKSLQYDSDPGGDFSGRGRIILKLNGPAHPRWKESDRIAWKNENVCGAPYIDHNNSTTGGYQIESIEIEYHETIYNLFYDRLGEGDPWPDGTRLEDWSGGTNLIGDYERREAQLQYHGIFEDVRDAWDALLSVAAVGRATVLLEGARVRFKPNEERDPVGFVGMGNIIENSFEIEYGSQKGKMPNAMTVEYLDREFDYDRKVVYVEHPDVQGSTSLDDVRVEALFVQGITSRVQAHRHGRFLLNIYNELDRSGSFRTAPDSMHYEVGDVVVLSHDLVEWGFGGRMIDDAVSVTQVKLDREVTIEAGKDYYLRWRNPVAGQLESWDTLQVTTGAGTYPAGSTITVSTGFIEEPKKGDLYLFYEDGTERMAEIVGHEILPDMSVRVDWIEYNADVYNIPDDEIPEAPANSTRAGNEQNGIIPTAPDWVKIEEREALGGSGGGSIELHVSWAPRPASEARPHQIAVLMRDTGGREDTGGWRVVATTHGAARSAVVPLNTAITNTSYTFAVQPISFGGAKASPDTCAKASIAVTGFGTKPPAPTNLAATFVDDKVLYTWELPREGRGLVVEVRRGEHWILGDTVFVSAPGETRFGPTRNWAGGPITVRARSPLGHQSDAVKLTIDSSVVGKDATWIETGNASEQEWRDWGTGWTGGGSPDTTLTNLTVNSDGDMEFTGSNLTASFTTPDPTVAKPIESREVYVEANCTARQVYGLLVSDANFELGDARASMHTTEGLAHSHEDLAAPVALDVEMRLTTDGTSSTWTDWRAYRPGKVRAAGVQYRLTLTRVDDSHDVAVESFVTQTSSKLPTLYDTTPEDSVFTREVFG